MWYLIIISIIVIGLVIGTGCKVSSNKNKTELVNMKIPHDSIPEVYTKKDIEKLLQDLSKSEPKNLESFGAMCYEMAMPPERVEYVCPTCGEKTLYTDNYTELISWDLQLMRDYAAKLGEINCKLDESLFCKSCSPKDTEPQLCLIVKLKEETEHKTCGINKEDFALIDEFISGSTVHKDFYDAETPLKNYLPRIEELLGVEIEKK
jgi:hypothetical protein